MAVFPILKKRVMTPKIPQPQYRLAASISIKGRQVERPDRTRLLTGRCQCCHSCHSCHRPPAASSAQAVSASWLQKIPVGLEPKQKQYSSKKKLQVQTLDCARSDLLLCLSDIYSVTRAKTLQIYTVKVQWKCSQTTVNCSSFVMWHPLCSDRTDLPKLGSSRPDKQY